MTRKKSKFIAWLRYFVSTEIHQLLSSVGLWPKAFAEILFNCSGVDAKVLAYLLLMKNHSNQITESQRSMANRLRISKTSFNKSLKKFKELNLICSARGGLMVNPDIIFYGKVERRSNACEEYKNFFNGPKNIYSSKT